MADEAGNRSPIQMRNGSSASDPDALIHAEPADAGDKSGLVSTQTGEAENQAAGTDEKERRDQTAGMYEKERRDQAAGMYEKERRDQAAGMYENESWALPQLTESGIRRQRRSSYLNGLLTGIALALVLFFICVSGRSAIRRLLGADAAASGAEVLTDSATFSKLKEIQLIIENDYLNEVDREQLSEYLFKGVAAGLNDDYANYYTAAELAQLMDSTKGGYYGIGAAIRMDSETGEFCVEEVYADSPAMKGGLLAGDIVQAVDGETVEAFTLNELVTLIKSKETFTMTVLRSSAQQELDLTITCGEVSLTYVEYEMLNDGIGYLQLTEFTERATDQFRDAVDDLNSQGMKKLIVDLRDNPGGLLSAVCDILDEILPEGLIVYTEDRNGNREEYNADNEQRVTCEVAVLVNGGSASASEIFAGAVQDYKRGLIVGTQTYGKGIVQKTYTLSDGSAFKLTVEHYYTPNGQEIQGNGITPDIIVEENGEDEAADPVLERAVLALSE